jgi:hypothetical protein
MALLWKKPEMTPPIGLNENPDFYMLQIRMPMGTGRFPNRQEWG